MTQCKLVTYVPLLILGIVVLHFLAVFSGLYDSQIQQGFVWIDNVLHALSGAVFALLWLWILEKKNWEISFLLTILSTLGFVLLLAVGWEVLEYFFYITFTDYAHSLQIYSPTFQEAISDIVSNLIGGIVLLLLVYGKHRLVQ